MHIYLKIFTYILHRFTHNYFLNTNIYSFSYKYHTLHANILKNIYIHHTHIYILHASEPECLCVLAYTQNHSCILSHHTHMQSFMHSCSRRSLLHVLTLLYAVYAQTHTHIQTSLPCQHRHTYMYIYIYTYMI